MKEFFGSRGANGTESGPAAGKTFQKKLEQCYLSVSKCLPEWKAEELPPLCPGWKARMPILIAALCLGAGCVQLPLNAGSHPPPLHLAATSWLRTSTLS